MKREKAMEHLTFTRYILLTALLFVIINALAAGSAHADLLAYFPFDSDYSDASTNGYVLTEVESGGTVEITTTAAEVANGNGAADFDSTISNHAYLELDTPITFANNSNWSVAFWVRRRSGTDVRTCMVAGDTGNNTDFIWCSDNASQVQGLRYRSTSNHTEDFDGYADDGNYHHWVVVSTNTGSRIIRVYRDGEFVSDNSASSSDLTIADIGHAYTATTFSMDGQIDDLAIFDGALTGTQITNVYNGDFSEWLPPISLSPASVASNAVPGTLVGALSSTDDSVDSFIVGGTGIDNADFEITESTNLRTRVWMDASSKAISIVSYSNVTALVTNDVNVNVTAAPADYAAFEVRSEVSSGVAAGTEVVGTLLARGADASSFDFAITGGRTDLFKIDGSGTNVVQISGSDPGVVGSLRYVSLQATNDVTSIDLVVGIEVISGTPSGSLFLFR